MSLLAAELRDTSSTRDRTMSELYHMKLEADALRQAKAEAQAQSTQLKTLIEQMKAEAKQEAVRRLAGLPHNIHRVHDWYVEISSIVLPSFILEN